MESGLESCCITPRSSIGRRIGECRGSVVNAFGTPLLLLVLLLVLLFGGGPFCRRFRGRRESFRLRPDGAPFREFTYKWASIVIAVPTTWQWCGLYGVLVLGLRAGFYPGRGVATVINGTSEDCGFGPERKWLNFRPVDLLSPAPYLLLLHTHWPCRGILFVQYTQPNGSVKLSPEQTVEFLAGFSLEGGAVSPLLHVLVPA